MAAVQVGPVGGDVVGLDTSRSGIANTFLHHLPIAQLSLNTTRPFVPTVVRRVFIRDYLGRTMTYWTIGGSAHWK